MNNQDTVFMRKAISLARKNATAQSGGPFGAVIVKDGVEIAASSNSVTVDNDPTAHAEVNTIRMACKKLGTFDLKGCVLYTSCEPCPMCLSAAYWAHIDKIYYSADKVNAAEAGFDDDFIYKELDLPIERRGLKMEKIIPEEGIVPFLEWGENDKKVEY